jgi:hypothetical protein
LLAEVYLSWAGYPCKDLSKYELAAETALEVIDSAGFYGFELEPDFINLWNGKGKYNNESVFCLFYNPLAINNGYQLYKGLCQERIISEDIYSSYQGFTTVNVFFIDGVRFTEVNFYNNYPRGYRRDITFFNDIYVPDDGYNHTPPLDTGYFYIDQVDPCSRVAYRKFYLDTILIPSGSSSKYYRLYGNPHIYMFRYAQTLLTYAEAAARSGNPGTMAYECINKIRRRANNFDIYTQSVYDLQPGLSPETFAD